ncbi:MAG: DUF1501 domain-containing protein, partial [Planctomycetaceae bacterium]|nr:DUF1501 domain-containing protein [Planctomycetaceae bacterium]
DLDKEDAALRDSYGRNQAGQRLLMARRLVEAGVRLVTLTYGGWDHHQNITAAVRGQMPPLDQALAVLLDDLQSRGLLDTTLVMVSSEFGRTPKINKNAGRDHWAPVQTALVAGGGMSMGQVIGSTDKTAAYAKDRPIDYRDVLATIYHAMGIDPHVHIRDANERPVVIMPDSARPIRELVG